MKIHENVIFPRYVAEYKDWAIGSFTNYNTKRCAVTTAGGLGTRHPYDPRNKHAWEYANGNGSWEMAPLDDVKVTVQGGNKIHF